MKSFIKAFSILMALFCIEMPAFSQNKHTISGYVTDSLSGETIIGANVYLLENYKGTTSNVYGFYSITVEEGNYTLVFSFVGYHEKRIQIKLDSDLRINSSLLSKAIQMTTAEVVGKRNDENVQSTTMGKTEMDMEQIKQLPAFMGEVDVLKALQLLPGVQSAGEGNSGFYVRGGGPDQNLLLLDEAVVYNASHLFGFFSVFNSDAIKNVTLTKGGMPANYGGRLSSVVDISMKDGNSKEFHGTGGIGYIASRFTIEGPIIKDTCSFILSARRTFIDLFLQPPFVSKTSSAYGNSYYFYDLNAKIHNKFSDKDHVYLSGYFGRDVFSFRSPESDFSADIPWGNATATLRWNHLFSDKLFVNTSAIFTDYKFEFGAGQEEFDFSLYSGVKDWNGKMDFSYFPSLTHTLKFGGNYVFHTFTPSTAFARSGDVVFDLGEPLKLKAHDAALYVNDEWTVSDRFSVNGGLRFTGFAQVGPFERYQLDPVTSQVNDTTAYSKGQVVEDYYHVEPRLTLRYALDPRTSVKAAYTQNYQYVNMASISSVSLPTDVWTPSTDITQPQYGVQYALGFFKNFMRDTFETSVEVYYKTMDNQIEYKEGAQPADDVKNNQDNNFTFGKGWSYGAEFFIKKRFGKFNGWIGYTIAWTKRQFEDLNNGETFYAKYDRRHDISIVLMFDLNKRWSFGATWVYATGNAATLPIERYLLAGAIDPSNPTYFNELNSYTLAGYGKRNDFRMEPYHRLDLSATLKGKHTEKFHSDWNFSIFNVYNRYNPYFIYFDTNLDKETNSLKVQAKQVSLFPIIPSVTWNFKF